MRNLAFLLVIAGGFVACSSSEPLEQSALHQQVEAGDTIRLHYGESAALGDSGARIVFRSVQTDSRCPVDVTCVWAGDAHVTIEGVSPDGGTHTLDLHTTLEPLEAEFAGYRLRMVELRPSRMDGVPVQPTDYSVRLAISRG